MPRSGKRSFRTASRATNQPGTLAPAPITSRGMELGAVVGVPTAGRAARSPTVSGRMLATGWLPIGEGRIRSRTPTSGSRSGMLSVYVSDRPVEMDHDRQNPPSGRRTPQGQPAPPTRIPAVARR
jgi:hypothetical protein